MIAATMQTSSPMIDRDGIAATERLIRPYIRRTPTVSVDPGDFGVATTGSLALKLETFQHTGSFKARGAFANLLIREVPQVGVAAASGGNHGVAVAFAAMRLGIKASIFVSKITSPAKMQLIRGYRADLVVTGETYAEAAAASQAFVARTGALAVHPFDQAETLLGQGSVGVELETDKPDIDTLLVAVGGGGLIGGIAAWYEGRTRVIAVEPETAPTLHNALAAGRPVEAPAGGVAADSLAPSIIGTLMFPIAQRYVARSILVSDEAILRAQRWLWDVTRIVVEPGGAAALAALTSGGYRPCRDERVAVLLCGANTSSVDFAR